MAERLRWWVIPGAVVVLLRVVTLEPATPATPAAALPTSRAISSPGIVIARDASGQRSAPMQLSTEHAFVLQLPADWARRRVSMRAWRVIDGVRDTTPWFFAEPRVRADATLPIAGMQQGRYDVEIVFGEGDAQQTLGGDDLPMPGTHALTSRR